MVFVDDEFTKMIVRLSAPKECKHSYYSSRLYILLCIFANFGNSSRFVITTRNNVFWRFIEIIEQNMYILLRIRKIHDEKSWLL